MSYCTKNTGDADDRFETGPYLMIVAGVSTHEQNTAMQKHALKQAGCEKIFSDTASSTRTDRPGLDKTFDHLRAGDTLVVWKLDRLGRSLQHLIETVKSLQEKKIGFMSLQENIDTTTGGKLVFHIFSALAEFERDVIRLSATGPRQVLLPPAHAGDWVAGLLCSCLNKSHG